MYVLKTRQDLCEEGESRDTHYWIVSFDPNKPRLLGPENSEEHCLAGETENLEKIRGTCQGPAHKRLEIRERVRASPGEMGSRT